MLAVVIMLALLATSHERALADGDNPTPQLPILLLNGAIYSGQYDAGSLPASFRADGYPGDVAALYLVQCEGPIKEVWVEDLRRIGGEPRGYVPYNTCRTIFLCQRSLTTGYLTTTDRAPYCSLSSRVA